jgi:hypothetical protein
LSRRIIFSRLKKKEDFSHDKSLHRKTHLEARMLDMFFHGDGVLFCTSRHCKSIIGVLYTEAGISNNNYCATNSGLPEVELRFCPWLILLKC